MIDLKKKYRTRSGNEVRLYADDGGDWYPIHGAIRFEDRWISASWGNDGKDYSGEGSGLDLIEIRPSQIERMIAWLEMEMEIKIEHSDTYSGDTLAYVLKQARLIQAKGE